MSNVLILDDESITLSRLFNVLSEERQHKLWTSDNLIKGAEVVEKLGPTLDLLIVDVSMLQNPAIELLDLFDNVCPQARVLAVSPTLKNPGIKGNILLRKPFTDEDLVRTVKLALAMPPKAAAAPAERLKIQHQSSCLDRPEVRVRASAR
jgi:two-component SAPR family response regulator